MGAPDRAPFAGPAHLRRPGISRQEQPREKLRPVRIVPMSLGQAICIVCIEFPQREPEEQPAGEGQSPNLCGDLPMPRPRRPAGDREAGHRQRDNDRVVAPDNDCVVWPSMTA